MLTEEVADDPISEGLIPPPPSPAPSPSAPPSPSPSPQVGDDPISEGLVPLARLARTSLLCPSGLFAPGKLRVYGMACSMRTLGAAGFDLRGFNAFRSTAGAHGYDFEEATNPNPNPNPNPNRLRLRGGKKSCGRSLAPSPTPSPARTQPPRARR